MKPKLLIYCGLLAIFLINCFPDGTSPKDKCRDGDPGGTAGKKPDRDFYCSMSLIMANSPNPRRYPSDEALIQSLCVDAQIKLNECNSKSTLPIGIGDVK
ncbi:hypothetical protein EHQ94_10860 [Leptospira meyeri]|uniref:hypothetical protein n=1 Tax=Leptospira meyeri TaxID=29508 RepID=UPI0010833F1B|nr:hypothetical protein [Leptospira meyeri]MCW7490926.1 hypothetical protein [Leptospira meyeri]TGM58956.1 hypothetical protein EHQ93_19680 [Leptospira meyeri]TGM66504.1 hypothetical protein EHQ94_10860 [Leptospira meyeri]